MTLSTSHNSHLLAGIDYEQFSSEFPFRMNGKIHEGFDWTNFHMCGHASCERGSRRVPFLHGQCFWPRQYAISESFLAAGEYTFNPPACEEPRRFNRMQSLLAPKLNNVLPVILPPKILIAIAGLLVRECATITAEQQSLGTSTSDLLIDLSRNIYATYHAVDGIGYVKSLSNSRPESHEKEVHVLHKEESGVRRIHVAEDHRGIRCVKFSSSDDLSSGLCPVARVWWRDMSVPSDITQIRVKTDVSTRQKFLD
jgi:hypothetical protein